MRVQRVNYKIRHCKTLDKMVRFATSGHLVVRRWHGLTVQSSVGVVGPELC